MAIAGPLSGSLRLGGSTILTSQGPKLGAPLTTVCAASGVSAAQAWSLLPSLGAPPVVKAIRNGVTVLAVPVSTTTLEPGEPYWLCAAVNLALHVNRCVRGDTGIYRVVRLDAVQPLTGLTAAQLDDLLPWVGDPTVRVGMDPNTGLRTAVLV